MKRFALIGVGAAMLLGAWLRTYGLAEQIVQDDEWHAIHKLMNAGYAQIVRSFGLADHSIPLTLLYKAMAGTIGLDEIDMRALQVACGIGLIAVAAWLAWRATCNAAVTVLLAFLLAGAPFLVLYSRFARPYAVTTLLVVVALATLWRWREARSVRLGAAVCLLAALTAWLHPLSALFPIAGVAFLLAAQPSRWRGTLALGICLAGAILLPLAVPLLNDWASLGAKAGRSLPSAYTLFRVVSLFAGGLPDLATAGVIALTAFGAWALHRAHHELGAYLAFVALAPVGVVAFLGGDWSHQGHTFARYVLPAQVIFLFWCAYGAVSLAARVPKAQPFVAAAAAIAYLAANPAIEQVRTLGPWYGHLYHHFDYIYEHNRAARWYEGWEVPDFYAKLRASGETTPLIEAPFNFDAPWNPLAFYAERHRQPERIGFLHDLCYTGPYIGEVPRDPRFRFGQFVFLDDREAVLRSGARYLVLHRESLHGQRFERSDECLAALERLYGEPVTIDRQVAVFDLIRASRDGPEKGRAR
jgi:hypothetical protein